MNGSGGNRTIDTRALECALAAVAALLVADGIRAAVEPFRRMLGLLIGF
jgi:hypothetical protein